ncbi:MAG: hypothetical protein F6K58_23575 [Symploca sp. SIO2E9]|nr:hypothetical protein [Symploca sp. SIO2E9]
MSSKSIDGASKEVSLAAVSAIAFGDNPTALRPSFGRVIARVRLIVSIALYK